MFSHYFSFMKITFPDSSEELSGGLEIKIEFI
jgi:hypothetical protein